MKSYSKIFTFVLAFMALCSCEQKSLVGVGGNNGGEDNIFIPSEGYIYFNITPTTRGELIEDVLTEKNFNVVGYNYQSNWGTARVQASQASQLSFEVNGEPKTPYMGTFYYQNATTNGVQLVEWNETDQTHGYTYNGPDKSQIGNYKEWDGNLIYSFFAWYPTNLEFNTGATKSDGTAIAPVNFEGNPYITYDLPQGEGARAAMEDVMTACRIDVTKYNGSSVNFNMEHRLAALDILANNIITLKSLKEAFPDRDFTEIENATDDVTITVENIAGLSLTLDAIKSSVKIPLNTNDDSEVMVASGSITPIYNDFVCTEISIPYYSTAEDMKTLMGDNKLILIPQTEQINASLTITYDVVVRVGNEIKMTIPYVRGSSADKKLETKINGLEEKYYHYLELTFTATGVYLQAKVEETWEPIEIKYSFE